MEQIVVRPIEIIFSIVSFAVLARVLLSWVRVDPTHPAVQFLFDITEPLLRPIREMMPDMGMFDFSPIIALLLLNVLQGLLLYIIQGLF
jgi:YggT family protein